MADEAGRLRLRAAAPVVWVDEPALHGQPAGPGFWLVLRHADVEAVLRDPGTFSSWLGATQVRDAADLEWVRRSMLNSDPPDHTRMRRLLARSFTPRAVAALTAAIDRTAAGLVDGMIGTDGEGRCDVAREVAADLPLLTLADVLGVPAEDRWLLYDWSNRVIGWQDPDYATSSVFDPASGTDLARRAVELRPAPGPDGRLPDPRTRAGMPDLYAYARLLAAEKRGAPGRDVMSVLLAQRDDGGAAVSDAEFENMFWLFAVAGNETLRNGLPGGLRWTAVHQPADYDPPHSFADELSSPLLSWRHLHQFGMAGGRSTLVTDVVETPLPARALKSMLVYRHRQLAADLAAAARRIVIYPHRRSGPAAFAAGPLYSRLSGVR